MKDIASLKDHVSIVSVISRSVKLHPVNANSWNGLCPFHDEHTPSFFVFKANYHCYGCGAHGDVIDFISKTRGVSLQTALEYLEKGDFPTSDTTRAPEPVVMSPKIKALYEGCRDTTTDGAYSTAARALGVSVESLKKLGAAWSAKKYAWMFPMRDATLEIVGFRFRAMNGKKWSLGSKFGGHNGLFVPSNFHFDKYVLFVEGPTDCAALITLGLQNVIGRPNSSGCVAMIKEFCNRQEINYKIIVADNDQNGAGMKGAESLRDAIGGRIVRTKAKDIRESVRKGLTREEFERAVYHEPSN